MLVCGYSSRKRQKCLFSCINKYNHKQSSMNNYYTYAYLREDGTPYYIGKGSGNRLYKNDGRYCNTPSKNRIIYLKQNLTEEEAFKHEIYMIAVFGRKDLKTGILHNRSDGGEGSSGAIRSKELRRRISNSMKGKSKTKSHNDKVSLANKGRIVSGETRKKISNKLKGKKLSDETKRKMSEGLKKRWESNKFKGTTGIKIKREKPTYVKHFVLTDMNGVEYNVIDGLKHFCNENNLNYNTIYYGLHYKNGQCSNGWMVKYESTVGGKL